MGASGLELGEGRGREADVGADLGGLWGHALQARQEGGAAAVDPGSGS